MKHLFPIFLLVASLGWGQSEGGPVGLSDLPSADSKPKLPALDQPAPVPSGLPPSESPSIPQLRPPAVDPVAKKKTDDSDWAAQGILQKKEEAKKRQEEEEKALAEKKAKEARDEQPKEKKDPGASSASAVAKPAVPGLVEGDTKKLPSVTGMEGVKPRAMASGDGRVQPGFDSFTGPGSSGPLGKDYQSGAKPIMPGASSADGRIQVPGKAPEPPSGAYKKVSQDPYTTPPGYGEKKPVTPPQPKIETKNPPAGNPISPGSPAGLSPYDNSKKVPDPRSQRRF